MQLGIGIFGSADQIETLVPILVEKDLKVTAIWNKSEKTASVIAKRFQIPFFTNKIDKVLLRKDVDLVFILSPPNSHAEISVKALGIGKHVLCNIPTGLNQCDSLRMVLASQYYPSLISIINYPLRFIQVFQVLKRNLIETYFKNGQTIKLITMKVDIGSLIGDQYDWSCDYYTAGGILTLVASHYIDLISYLIGMRAIKAIGTLRTLITSTDKINGIRYITAPDFCNIQLEFPNNLLVTATFNSHYPKNYFKQEFFICGSTDTYFTLRDYDLYQYENDMENEQIIYKDLQESDSKFIDNLPQYFSRGWKQMFDSLKEAFFPVHEKSGWIKESVQIAATFDDGLYVQAVIEAVKRSSKTKEWEKVELMTEQPEKYVEIPPNIMQSNSESKIAP